MVEFMHIADLIIDNKVDGAAHSVTFKSRQTKTFGNDALSGKCGVAMQQHG